MLYFLLRILFFSSGKTVGEKSVFNNFNALMGLSCYDGGLNLPDVRALFQCPHGLELLRQCRGWKYRRFAVSMPSRAWVVTRWKQTIYSSYQGFNALTGLSCYMPGREMDISQSRFNALTGLSCYWTWNSISERCVRFNALTGLSCYGKNVQYFKFFMILFIHTCYL